LGFSGLGDSQFDVTGSAARPFGEKVPKQSDFCTLGKKTGQDLQDVQD
jgi:hypothetical protein